MLIPTIDLITVSDIWSTTIQVDYFTIMSPYIKLYARLKFYVGRHYGKVVYLELL